MVSTLSSYCKIELGALVLIAIAIANITVHYTVSHIENNFIQILRSSSIVLEPNIVVIHLHKHMLLTWSKLWSTVLIIIKNDEGLGVHNKSSNDMTQ